jgi:hypothetical protein
MSLADLLPLNLDKLSQFGAAGLAFLAKTEPQLAPACSALTALLPLILHIPAVSEAANHLIGQINGMLGYGEPATA